MYIGQWSSGAFVQEVRVDNFTALTAAKFSDATKYSTRGELEDLLAARDQKVEKIFRVVTPGDRHWIYGYRSAAALVAKIQARGRLTTAKDHEKLLRNAKKVEVETRFPLSWHDGGILDATLDAFN